MAVNCPKCGKFRKDIVDKSRLVGWSHIDILSYCEGCDIYFWHSGGNVLEEWGEVCYHGGSFEITKERFEILKTEWESLRNLRISL